jgi:hypothetical protein
MQLYSARPGAWWVGLTELHMIMSGGARFMANRGCAKSTSVCEPHTSVVKRRGDDDVRSRSVSVSACLRARILPCSSRSFSFAKPASKVVWSSIFQALEGQLWASLGVETLVYEKLRSVSRRVRSGSHCHYRWCVTSSTSSPGMTRNFNT